MPQVMIVQEGTGTKVYWKYPKDPKFVRLPIQITQASVNSINTPQIPTSHLNSKRPRRNGSELGGQTFQAGILEDPGMLVIDGFFDPSVRLPEGDLLMQIRFIPRRGWAHGARIDVNGFFTDRSITIPLSASMTSSRSMKLSGVIHMIQARRTGTIVPL